MKLNEQRLRETAINLIFQGYLDKLDKQYKKEICNANLKITNGMINLIGRAMEVTK